MITSDNILLGLLLIPWEGYSVSCRFVEIPVSIISVRSWELMIVACLDETGHSLCLFNLLPKIVSCSTQTLTQGVIRLMIFFASGFCSTLKGFVPLTCCSACEKVSNSSDKLLLGKEDEERYGTFLPSYSPTVLLARVSLTCFFHPFVWS